MPRLSLIPALLCLTSACVLASVDNVGEEAGLVWESQHVSRKALSSRPKVEADFVFRNAGDRTVKIVEIKPSCECTVTNLEDRDISPGESGRLTAVLDIGPRRGHLDIHIDVTTDASPEPAQLTFTIDIEEQMTVHPRVVSWPDRSDRSPRTVTLVFAQTGRIERLEAVPDKPGLSVKARPTDDPSRWELIITPEGGTEDTRRPRIAVKAHTESAGVLETTVYSYVR